MRFYNFGRNLCFTILGELSFRGSGEKCVFAGKCVFTDLGRKLAQLQFWREIVSINKLGFFGLKKYFCFKKVIFIIYHFGLNQMHLHPDAPSRFILVWVRM